jgi:serine/threonine-protein kinase RsbW
VVSANGDTGGSPPGLTSCARAFPGTAEQVRAARRFVASLLDGSPFCDDAVIVISELFTNAIVHTRSGKPGGLVIVQVSRSKLGVRLMVTDQGSAQQPVIRDTGGQPTENGHGLYAVRCLTERLDWHEDASGRTVRAVLGMVPAGEHAPAAPDDVPAGHPEGHPDLVIRMAKIGH